MGSCQAQIWSIIGVLSYVVQKQARRRESAQAQNKPSHQGKNKPPPQTIKNRNDKIYLITTKSEYKQKIKSKKKPR